MATFQGITGLFLPSQRRRARTGGGGGPKVDPATQRLLEGINGVLEPFNAPNYLTEYLTDDLKEAFKIKGPYRPGYEPGRIAPADVNLIDFVTDPIETTWKTVKKPFESTFSSAVDVPAIFSSQLDAAVWDYLYKNSWTPTGATEPVVPASTRAAVVVWNQRTGVRITRHLAADAVRWNPGMTVMKARVIADYYSPTGPTPNAARATRFRGIQTTAEPFDKRINSAFSQGETLKAQGDEFAKTGRITGRGNAKDLWEGADDKFQEADRVQKEWKEGCEKLWPVNLRDETDREFKRLSGRGSALYNSPEAKFSRFFEARNKHYATLNLLRTYKKDGFLGVAKWYGWKQLTNTFKDYYYATRLNDALNAVAKKLGVTKLLGKFANFQTFAKRFLSARNIVANALKNVAKSIITKLGLGEFVGGILGSALPGAGTAIGAVVGAVVQFAGEVIVEKLGGVMKILGYVLAGVIGSFAIFVVAITALLSIILGDIRFPWEATALEIDCNQSATTTSSCVLPKATVKGVADRWGVGPGNHVNECYSDVIAKSKAAGVDPRLAMATWLNESNASNYEMYERLGEPPQDFGIPAQKGKGFTAQINSFLNFVKQSKVNYPACYQGQSQAAGFYRAFCTVGREEFGVGTCSNLTDQGKKCVAKYLSVYSVVNAGGTCN